MSSGSSNIMGPYTIGNEYPFKKLLYISKEYTAYVEIKFDVTLMGAKDIIFTYHQQDINKAALYLLLSQGEIKLKRWPGILGIDFKLVKNASGYDLVLESATLDDNTGYKIYATKEKITFPIQMGSSTIKNVQIEYSVLPERPYRKKIFLNIIEANINILSSTDPKDQWLKKNYDTLFYDEKTIIIEAVTREPQGQEDY